MKIIIILLFLSGVAFAADIRSVQGAYTTDAKDVTVLCDASVAPLTITLVRCNSITRSITQRVKKMDATPNVCTVDPDSTQLIDGSSEYVLTSQNAIIALQCDGANWAIIAAPVGVVAQQGGGATNLVGDVTGSSSANDLDESAVESELESVLDLPELQGTLTDTQVPDNITIDFAASAGTTTNYSGNVTDAQVPDTHTHTAASIPDAALQVNYSGVGQCQAGQFVTALNDASTPTCAAPAGGGGGGTYIVLASDVTNATVNYANVTGLSFAVAANTRYDIECKILYNASAATNGIGISWTGPTGATVMMARMISGIGTQTVGGTTIAGNDTGLTTSASAGTTNNNAVFEGMWANGSNAGTLQLRFRAEAAATNAIVIKAGSFCKYSVY